MDKIGDLALRTIQPKGEVSRQSRSRREIAELAKKDADGLPEIYDRALDLELPRKVFAHWIPSVGPRAITRALTGLERTALQIRAASLEVCLSPFPHGDANVMSALAGMFSGFRSMRQQGEDAMAMLEVTMSVLAEFPAWAVIRACVNIAKEKRQFAPHDGEIYDAVKTIIKLYKTHCQQAQALLDAPVEPPTPVATGSRYREPEEHFPRPVPHDGRHFDRIKNDLEARRIRAEREASRSPADSEETK